MNIPQIIHCPDVQPVPYVPPSPSVSAFRLKGCRYQLTYTGHLPKEVFLIWFKDKVLGKKYENEVTIFIGHITIHNTKLTRVLFRTLSTIDWKSASKFDFKIEQHKFRPEIKAIYKCSWAIECNTLFQLDKDYDSINPQVICARSPKRINGMGSVPPTPETPVSEAPVLVPNPVSEAPVSEAPVTTLQDSIKNVIEEMGIMKLILNIENRLGLLGLTLESPPKPLESKQEVQYYIYIEGEACDVITDSTCLSFVLENKSVITITDDETKFLDQRSKIPIFKSKNDLNKTKELLQKYGVWFYECNTDMMTRRKMPKLLPLPGQVISAVHPEDASETSSKHLIMKNTDLMILNHYLACPCNEQDSADGAGYGLQQSKVAPLSGLASSSRVENWNRLF